MEFRKMTIAVSLALAALLLLYFGEKIIADELKQTENERRCRIGRNIWKAGGSACLSILIAVYFISGMNIPDYQFIFILYVLLYTLFIGIVDFFSHNYYLEMLPGLLLFIPIGCITNGFTDAMIGLLAGICLGGFAALSEWLFFRRISCGGGDAVFCAVSSALIGYVNLPLYGFLLAVILLFAAFFHIVYVKMIKKQNLSENRFVPLLPWFSLITAGYYAFTLFVPMAEIYG